MENKHYIKALQFNILTPFYDPVIRLITRETKFKNRLIAQMTLNENSKILDIGCGTGTLALKIKQRYPQVEITGLDADFKILERTSKKFNKAGLRISLLHGSSTKINVPDSFFDAVTSTLMFHHLNPESKVKTLDEICRILRPGGMFYFADYSVPHCACMKMVSFITKGLEEMRDNLNGNLVTMMVHAGFNNLFFGDNYSTVMGTIGIFILQKPHGGKNEQN